MAREMRTIGQKFDAEMHFYGVCKYTNRIDEIRRVTYPDVTEWEIVSGEDAKEIEEQGLIDDFHEYLVLYFEHGETATFRNSYCDMYRDW